jgi:hypothetical protein
MFETLKCNSGILLIEQLLGRCLTDLLVLDLAVSLLETDSDIEQDIAFELLLLRIAHGMDRTDICSHSQFAQTLSLSLKHTSVEFLDNILRRDTYVPSYLVTDVRKSKLLKFFELYILSTWCNDRVDNIIRSDDVTRLGDLTPSSISIDGSIHIFRHSLGECIMNIFDNSDIPIRFSSHRNSDEDSDGDEVAEERELTPLENIPTVPEITRECAVCLEAESLLQLACHHICCYTCYSKVGDNCPNCRAPIVHDLTKRLPK